MPEHASANATPATPLRGSVDRSLDVERNGVHDGVRVGDSCCAWRGVSRRWAVPVFGGGLLLLCVASTLGPRAPGQLGLLSYVMVGLCFNGALLATAALFSPRPCQRRHAPALNVANTSSFNEEVPLLAPRAAERLTFLDNLRSFLVLSVVAGHSLLIFMGGDFPMTVGLYRSAFSRLALVPALMLVGVLMPSFFGVAAYFLPTSLARHGRARFVRSKALRLLLPYLVYSLLLEPALQLMALQLAAPPPHVAASVVWWFPQPSVSWFLPWLAAFSFAYALTRGEARPRQPPRWWALAAMGLLLGIVQALQLVLLPVLVGMPIDSVSLPFYITLFLGGVAAQRGGWLTPRAPERRDSKETDTSGNVAEAALLLGDPAARWGVRGVAAASAAALATLSGLFLAEDVNLIAANDCGRPFKSVVVAAGEPNASLAWRLSLMAWPALPVLLGPYALTGSAGLVDVFRRHAACSTPLGKVLARDSYAIYLVHPFTLTGALALYLAALRGAGVAHVQFDTPGRLASTTCLPEAALWGGFAFVLVVGGLASWGLADVVRRLPGIRSVL